MRGVCPGDLKERFTENYKMKKVHENRLSVVEIRMLKYTCNETTKVKIRNEYIKGAIGVNGKLVDMV